MEMLAVLLVCLLVAAIIMPWVNHGRLIYRGREVDRLKQEVDRLSRKVLDLESPGISGRGTDVAEEGAKAFRGESVVRSKPAIVLPPPMPKVARASEVVEQSLGEKPVALQERNEEEQAQVTQDWFGKLAVWVGGVALLMAGFYMVKYSIDSGWLTASVRLWATAIFGVLLCSSGFVIGLKSDSPGNLRIGQALTGAGVACLYFAVYASVNLYGFVSSGWGFAGMVAVTALAVGLPCVRC